MDIDFTALRSKMVDVNGRYLTSALFVETATPNATTKYFPIFTLKDREHKGFPSLKQIYLGYQHLPGHEYDFAMDVFGSWEHWNKIAEESRAASYVAKWRIELEAKIKSRAMKSLIDTALNEGAKGANMAKYLVEGGWRTNSRGRPSKEELQRELKVQAGLAREFQDDLERIGLTVIQGGRK